MTDRPVSLTRIEKLLDETFAITEFGVDPSFRRFIPMVYDPIGFDWRGSFEPEFTERLNGVMVPRHLRVCGHAGIGSVLRGTRRHSGRGRS